MTWLMNDWTAPWSCMSGPSVKATIRNLVETQVPSTRIEYDAFTAA
jgi:hypothetical protein